MKNILIISDNIQQINKLRHYFSDEYKVSATNSADTALNTLQNKKADLALYHAVTDLSGFFSFYKTARQNPATENVPLIAVADTTMLKTLVDTVELKNAAFISTLIAPDKLRNLADTFLM